MIQFYIRSIMNKNANVNYIPFNSKGIKKMKQKHLKNKTKYRKHINSLILTKKRYCKI